MSTRMQDLMRRALAELRYEPVDWRVRARAGSETVADSTRALLVWEPRRVVPTYAVPAEDIRAELAPAPAAVGEVPDLLHPGIPFSIRTTPGEPMSVGGRAGAGFRPADPDLDGYVILDFAAFEWLEEDEPITGHPRDPFSRIEVRRTERPVRIELDGEVLAATTNARLLFETHVPTRFYLPREDVLVELRRSDRRTHCPYKGHASYFSAEVAGRLREHLCWSYEEPRHEAAPIAGLVAFWNEQVDIVFDGERRPRPRGAIPDAMRDEFGL